MPPSSALPLSTPSKSQAPKSLASASKDKTPMPKTATTPAVHGEISSPHELTAFVREPFVCICQSTHLFLQVETLLEQLDTKFEEMSVQILDRSASEHRSVDVVQCLIQLFATIVGQMSSRVDALEASLQDIINGDVAAPANGQNSMPPSPLPTSGSGSRI